MRTFLSASVAAALLAVAVTPVTAAAQSQTATGQKSKAAKKVCRWIEPRTGSMIKERICLTAQDWKKVEELLAE